MHITTNIPAYDKGLLETFQAHLINQDLAPRTIKVYLHDLTIFHQWMTSITRENPGSMAQAGIVDLAAFRKHLAEEKSLKPATVNRRIQSLRLFFRWLKEQKHIEHDPAEKLHFMRISKHRKPYSLTRDEVLSILRAANISPHKMEKRNFALVQLMLQTGMRVSEVADLKQEHVKIKAHGGFVRIVGKGFKEREVPLNTSARRALSEYFEHIAETSPKDPVFYSNRKTALSARTIQKTIANIVKRAGIKRIQVSNNTFRHTFAVNYLKSNPGKLVELASILGHESLNTTAVYTWPTGEDLAKDLERIPLNVLGE
jgi:integrase/recombinase XerC